MRDIKFALGNLTRSLVISMCAKRNLARLVQKIQNFRAANLGNVAITFALSTLPILGAVGFAVDFSHANSVKADLQAALDSTSLMLSHEVATDTNTQLQTNARNYFLAMFNRPEAKNITVTVVYDANNASQVVVNAYADVPTTFLGAIGYDHITVNSSGTAKWGTSRLRVALVLDNTGSMGESGKMPALISATKSLLTQLKNAVTVDGDVYVSVIPFVKDVNLGAPNWNSDYLYWGTSAQDVSLSDDNSWDAINGTCQDSGGAVIGSYNPRSTCLNQKSCSVSGFTSSEQLHQRGQLLGGGQ